MFQRASSFSPSGCGSGRFCHHHHGGLTLAHQDAIHKNIDQNAAAQDAAEQAEEAVKEAKDWLQIWARVGYYARGVVFTLIGALALKVAIGWGGQAEGSRGALREIGRQPFGQILLGLTALGLFGYVFWRFAQAIFDPGFDAQGVAKVLRRVAFAGSGAFYALMAFTAAQLSFGAKSWQQSSKEEWTAWALTLPMGRWLVALIAAVILGVGAHALYRAYVAQFMQLYRTQDMSDWEQRLARRLGRAGLSALGLTLLLIGGLLLQGAIQINPQKATGIGGALRVLAVLPYGPYLLGAAGLGFVAYGLHCVVLGRFRHIRPEQA